MVEYNPDAGGLRGLLMEPPIRRSRFAEAAPLGFGATVRRPGDDAGTDRTPGGGGLPSGAGLRGIRLPPTVHERNRIRDPGPGTSHDPNANIGDPIGFDPVTDTFALVTETLAKAMLPFSPVIDSINDLSARSLLNVDSKFDTHAEDTIGRKITPPMLVHNRRAFGLPPNVLDGPDDESLSDPFNKVAAEMMMSSDTDPTGGSEPGPNSASDPTGTAHGIGEIGDPAGTAAAAAASADPGYGGSEGRGGPAAAASATPSISAPSTSSTGPTGMHGGMAGPVGPDGQAVGSGSGGSKVICAELYRQGLLEPHLYEADERFGRHMPLVVLMGYWLWAMPLVRLMRRSRRFTGVMRCLSRPFVKAIAHDFDPVLYPIGILYLLVGLPTCAILGAPAAVLRVTREV